VFDSKQEEAQYYDYIKMIKHINPAELNFVKVSCGGGTTFLIDGMEKYHILDKNELWGFG
jgi:hypothetical protein